MQSAQATTDTVTITGLVGTDTQMSVVNAHLDLVITPVRQAASPRRSSAAAISP